MLRSGENEKDPRALLDGGGMFDDVLDTFGASLTESQRTKRSSSVYGKFTEEQAFEEFTDKSSQEEFDKSISLLEICVQSQIFTREYPPPKWKKEKKKAKLRREQKLFEYGDP